MQSGSNIKTQDSSPVSAAVELLCDLFVFWMFSTIAVGICYVLSPPRYCRNAKCFFKMELFFFFSNNLSHLAGSVVCAPVSRNVREWKDALRRRLCIALLHWYSAHRKHWVQRISFVVSSNHDPPPLPSNLTCETDDFHWYLLAFHLYILDLIPLVLLYKN